MNPSSHDPNTFKCQSCHKTNIQCNIIVQHHCHNIYSQHRRRCSKLVIFIWEMKCILHIKKYYTTHTSVAYNILASEVFLISLLQHLEFLGNSVPDYIRTMHLYHKYPGISPGLLTDLRSASVNNDFYSLCAIRAGLQKHILHASQKLHRQLESSLQKLDPLLMEQYLDGSQKILFPRSVSEA